MVKVLAEHDANLEATNDNGATPALMAAFGGHADVITELATAKPYLVNVPGQAPGLGSVSLLKMAAGFGHTATVKALILSGATVTAHDLKQSDGSPGNARQLRAVLMGWIADILAQQRAFRVFLLGCSRGGTQLSKLGGLEYERRRVGAFVGITVGVELGRVRAAGEAIQAVIWEDVDDAATAYDWRKHLPR